MCCWAAEQQAVLQRMRPGPGVGVQCDAAAKPLSAMLRDVFGALQLLLLTGPTLC